MSTDPATLEDASLLRSLMANAKKAGREDLVLACQARIAELAGRAYDDVLEGEFWRAVTAAEEIATSRNGRTTRLTRTRQKAKRVGAVQCLIDWALDNKVTQGFEILVGSGRGDLTGEAIVARYPEKFPAAAVMSARAKLAKYGVVAAP